VLEEARRGDFIYLDPPYHPRSATADFTSYTQRGFDVTDQERLADVYQQLVRRGCAVLLSNSDTPFIRRLYRGWRIDSVLCPRAVNSTRELGVRLALGATPFRLVVAVARETLGGVAVGCGRGSSPRRSPPARCAAFSPASSRWTP
jgi:hypothetical protein